MCCGFCCQQRASSRKRSCGSGMDMDNFLTLLSELAATALAISRLGINP